MDKRYVTLFRDLAQATAASAEAVIDYDREKGDDKGLAAAMTMRDDFQALTDKINVNSDTYTMSKEDAARFLVGAMIQINQLQDRIENLKKAMTGYQTDIVPKLQAIIEVENDEEARKLAEEKFIISEK